MHRPAVPSETGYESFDFGLYIIRNHRVRYFLSTDFDMHHVSLLSDSFGHFLRSKLNEGAQTIGVTTPPALQA